MNLLQIGIAINTLKFVPGTEMGAMSNVFGGGFSLKSVPSFSWGRADELHEHQLEKALDTARRVMARRKVAMSPEYERMLRHGACTHAKVRKRYDLGKFICQFLGLSLNYDYHPRLI